LPHEYAPVDRTANFIIFPLPDKTQKYFAFMVRIFYT